MEFQCRGCGYKFKRDKAPEVCPYCSQQGKIGPVKTAQDWINETVGKD